MGHHGAQAGALASEGQPFQEAPQAPVQVIVQGPTLLSPSPRRQGYQALAEGIQLLPLAEVRGYYIGRQSFLWQKCEVTTFSMNDVESRVPGEAQPGEQDVEPDGKQQRTKKVRVRGQGDPVKAQARGVHIGQLIAEDGYGVVVLQVLQEVGHAQGHATVLVDLCRNQGDVHGAPRNPECPPTASIASCW